MTKDEALKMPDLPRPYWNISGSFTKKQMIEYAKQACKEALAETQEPVAVVGITSSGQIAITNPDGTFFDVSKHIGAKFYTTPPSREWVGLSDEEIDAIFPLGDDVDVLDVARGIEAKLRERNNA